jgi:flavin-dependent dehydrogenase
VSPVDSHEVVVLGAGPAGSAAATLLARRGHSVAMVRPASTPYAELAEAVPPSARKLLEEIGALQAMERAGFVRNGGNTVWWAGRPVRQEAFDEDGGGFHVERRGLEDVLVQVALDAGVQVYEATARSSAEGSGAWVVACEAAGRRALSLTAPWLLDATGRRGLLARREGRIHSRETATLALLGRWRRPGGWDDEAATHTLVESYPSGWAWSVPLGRELRCFSVMVDHRQAPLQGTHVAQMFESELRKTAHIRGWLEGSEPVGHAWACPASQYHARTYARRGLLLVGDAGSFIDPLSSFGVKKALSSGWMAAVAAHTALVDPTMESAAIELYDGREREVVRRYGAVSSRYYAEAAEAYGHAYWSVRAATADGSRLDETALDSDERAVDPDALDASAVAESDVRAAFEAIRTRERLDAARGPTLRTIQRHAIAGYRIVRATHLASDAHPEGLRFVRSVDLARIVELAPEIDDVPDLWSAYNAGAPPVPLPDFLTGLATAFAAGFLVHRPG